MKYILKFKQISKKDVPVVGGKNASLGEMLTKLSRKGVNIPDGFATTAQAYFYFLKYNQIDKELKKLFKKFNPESISSLTETGKKARNLILKAKFPEDLKQEIIKSYKDLSLQYQKKKIAVAVRSSATAEDLPSASFAGQHETYLNVSGEKNLLLAVKKCISSLFTDRAISYREQKGFDHLKIALSVGVQKMVRSDVGSAGVAFTLDTDTGFRKVVLINSIWGLGEMVVKGKITPDQFYVFKPTLNKGYRPIIVKNLGRKTKKLVLAKSGSKEKPVSKRDQFRFSLTDDEVLTLAKWAVKIENLYGCPQDIEWAKDGVENKLYIVQSRPETVYGSKKIEATYFEYQLKTGKYQFGRINFPNGDMVGHTGNEKAIIKAVEAVDKSVGELLKVIQKLKGIAIVLADHGNAEQMFEYINHKKVPCTSHTLNPVPFVIFDPQYKEEYVLAKLKKRGLSNVAATILNLLGFEKPSDYDPSLIEFKFS